VKILIVETYAAHIIKGSPKMANQLGWNMSQI